MLTMHYQPAGDMAELDNPGACTVASQSLDKILALWLGITCKPAISLYSRPPAILIGSVYVRVNKRKRVG